MVKTWLIKPVPDKRNEKVKTFKVVLPRNFFLIGLYQAGSLLLLGKADHLHLVCFELIMSWT